MPISLDQIKAQDAQLQGRIDRNQLFMQQVREDNKERTERKVAPKAENYRESDRKPAQPVAQEKKQCECGCGENIRPKGRFASGHDARFYGRIKRVLEGKIPLELADKRTQGAIARGEQGHGSLAPRWNVLKGDTPPRSLEGKKNGSR